MPSLSSDKILVPDVFQLGNFTFSFGTLSEFDFMGSPAFNFGVFGFFEIVGGPAFVVCYILSVCLSLLVLFLFFLLVGFRACFDI